MIKKGPFKSKKKLLSSGKRAGRWWSSTGWIADSEGRGAALLYWSSRTFKFHRFIEEMWTLFIPSSAGRKVPHHADFLWLFFTGPKPRCRQKSLLPVICCSLCWTFACHHNRNLTTRFTHGRLGLILYKTFKHSSTCLIISCFAFIRSPTSRFMKAVCFYSGQTGVRQKTLGALQSSTNHILLISLEAVTSTGPMGLMISLLPTFLPPVAFVCINEAHCVSQWSHNFRPFYLRICKVIPIINFSSSPS